jgi:hypothetical protein
MFTPLLIRMADEMLSFRGLVGIGKTSPSKKSAVENICPKRILDSAGEGLMWVADGSAA